MFDFERNIYIRFVTSTKIGITNYIRDGWKELNDFEIVFQFLLYLFKTVIFKHLFEFNNQ